MGHTSFHLAHITARRPSIQIARAHCQLPSALENVLITESLGRRASGMDKGATASASRVLALRVQSTCNRISIRMAQSLACSSSTRASNPTSLAFTRLVIHFLIPCSEGMLSRSWGGVLRTVLRIGWLRTVGMRTGEIMVSSKLIVATTNARLKMPQSMAAQLLDTRSLTPKLSCDCGLFLKLWCTHVC